MVFHDLLDDRQPQPGALLTGRDVGLGQFGQQVGRVARAVIVDGQHRCARVGLLQRHADQAVAHAAIDDRRLQRLGRVLDQVDQRLGDQLWVTDDLARLQPGQILQPYALEAVALQRDHASGDFHQIMIIDPRRRHPRKRREFIHHAGDVADLGDDGIGTGLEHLGAVLDLLEIAALEPLSRELDRGQGVLDFVGNPARYV